MATLARWADESPEAMRRLLTEADLQGQMLGAIADVIGPADEGRAAALA